MNYFELFGKPLDHASVQELIQRYFLVDELKDIIADVERDLALADASYVSNYHHTEYHQARYSRIVDDQYQDMLIGLSAAQWSYQELGPEHAKRVDELMFWPSFTGTFPLAFNPSVAPSEVKLGRLIKKEKTEYGYQAQFLIDDFEVTATYVDANMRFASLSIHKVSPHQLLRLSFDDALKRARNLDKDFLLRRLEFEAQSPIHAWRNRQMEGDDGFTQPGLAQAELIIAEFLTDICNAAAANRPRSILTALKRAIKSFNKLNRAHASMIETSEREELVPFLHKVIRAAGLDVPEGLDLSLEWRDW
jgi:hypothetical protein